MTRAEKIAACTVSETGRGFAVTSPSGNTYTVTARTKLDENGSMYFVRRCTCLARGDCVHLAAVEQYQWAAGVDPQLLERTS